MTSVELTATQARVLGCLMEKAKTTPDAYPLSLNSLRVACNQSTNRDPVVSYDDATVQAALDGLRELQLATRSKAPGERAIKFKHRADETLVLNDRQYALICVLMLRGAQTPGELKQRTERINTFDGVDDVQATLDELGERQMVTMLERRPGQKEHRWIQLLCAPEESDSRSEVVVSFDSAPTVTREPRPSHAPTVADKTMAIINPATGDTIRTVEVADDVEIAAKLKRARVTQKTWAARDLAERIAIMQLWKALIADNLEACAQVVTAETGKAIAHSRNELSAIGERIDYYCDHVASVIEPVVIDASPTLEERISYEPRGVVAHISAWNYPYFVGLNSIVPALLTGNAVMYKPSELATMTGLQLVDFAHRAGVPADAFQCVVGKGPTGAALVESGVDLVCFTGSFGTGRAIAKAAADRLIPVQLELGGKDAVYVADDVDVDAVAASVIEGVMYNAGQSCCAIERVYVHARIWEPFVAAMRDAAGEWRPGDPQRDTTNMGALARAEQPAMLQAQVDDAVAKGARVLIGGELLQRSGNWYPATVVVDATHNMMLMREESFGPVIGVARVRDDDHAQELFDDTEFGLTGSIFTKDRARAEAFLGSVDTGTVYWNCSDRTAVRLPWAGRRHSGLGVSMSTAGMRAFVQEKAWHCRPQGAGQ